ncbi:MAG: tRNA-dihydrouridine synthase family protein [Anaerolineaceae bacterium]|nr:tRNA-dihydrouridine synthase family protein [Anaerolineaceae bacterium]
MSDPKPVFSIGNIPVYGDLVLAPMDGVSDAPYRALIRRMGSAMSTTEFVNTLELFRRKQALLNNLTFEPFERPFSVQLLDSEPERMVAAAKIIYEVINPDLFDINFGCPDRRVTYRGAGSALMRDPNLVTTIVRQLKAAVPVPITAKIRLGWDNDSRNYMEIAKIIEAEGAQMLAIHGRTTKQGYRGHANWEPIAEVKAALKIPVLGNGDVNTVVDISRIKAETNCDAVMIGRAAIANPWIFARKDRHEIPPEIVQPFMHKQLDAMLGISEFAGIRRFRKYAKAYLEPYAIPREPLHALLICTEAQEFKDQLDRIFDDFVLN